MYDSVVGIICDGDFPGRDIGRKYLTIEDLEILAKQKEKAAATNSDQFKENQ
ncbi:hypothetical protein SDC9_81498 [bioreactor metagenome]|uniref:Uncharacterized protein n=1 Tax=bioreactor metagenome TaxID=1076179 RepID=A0A644Z3Q1_9ZZZZ